MVCLVLGKQRTLTSGDKNRILKACTSLKKKKRNDRRLDTDNSKGEREKREAQRMDFIKLFSLLRYTEATGQELPDLSSCTSSVGGLVGPCVRDIKICKLSEDENIKAFLAMSEYVSVSSKWTKESWQS